MLRFVRPLRGLFVCLSLLVPAAGAVLVAPGVLAAPAKKPVAVGRIDGPQGQKARAQVLKILKANDAYEITDAEDLRAGSDRATYATMASALLSDAIVVGRVSRKLDLTLIVIGRDGASVGEVKIKGGSVKALQKAIDNELEILLAEPLGATSSKKAAAESAPDDEEEEEESEEDEELSEDEEEEDSDEGGDEEEEDSGEPAEAGPRPFELLAGARFYQRKFEYTNLLLVTPGDRDVRPYSVVAPAVVFNTRIYPFAFFQNDAWAHLGLMAKVEFGIATTTNYRRPVADGTFLETPLNTGTSEWQVGLRGRLPIAAHELGVFGLYGAHSFVLAGDEGPTQAEPTRLKPIVPDTDYRYLRIGMDGRVRINKLTIGAHFSPRFLVSMANVDLPGYWFPGATGSGVDFGASLAYELLSFLDVAAGADFVRYGFDFNGIPDDAGSPNSIASVIAGGATDTYLSGWAGVVLHFGDREPE